MNTIHTKSVKYMKFLRVIQMWKLHWLCCKWRYFVTDQLAVLGNERGLQEHDGIQLHKQPTRTMETHTNTEKIMSQVIAK